MVMAIVLHLSSMSPHGQQLKVDIFYRRRLLLPPFKVLSMLKYRTSMGGCASFGLRCFRNCSLNYILAWGLTSALLIGKEFGG